MGHPKETGKSGIGSKKRWNGSTEERSSSSRPFKPKFSTLRKVSKKQRKRNDGLKVKLKRMKIVQETYGYQAHCQMCLGKVCKNEGLVAEHIETRNEWDADRYENLGIAGWKCNQAKGSVRTGDYRPGWFVEEMRKLDKGIQ
jgi:5-methylcytosine-specific restriction endonuclease McrA